jgi:hypothetical protein
MAFLPHVWPHRATQDDGDRSADDKGPGDDKLDPGGDEK